jgi:hypothetical protein
MLPGFRFLFAAIVLSMSVLIFGLGAAALLRAAHEEFASIPSRRPLLPQSVFAQSEPPAPTLALLRVEPPVEKASAPDNTAADIGSGPAEPAPEAVPVPPVETERLAALKIEDSASSETAKPERAAEPPLPSTAAAPVQGEAPASANETKIAAVEQTPSPIMVEAAPANLEPLIVSPAPESMGVPTKIATLGGPAVKVEQPVSAKPTRAKADRSAIKKQERAQRAKEERRRQAAKRARLARQAAAAQQQQPQTQQQADPFSPQPTITMPRKKR